MSKEFPEMDIQRTDAANTMGDGAICIGNLYKVLSSKTHLLLQIYRVRIFQRALTKVHYGQEVLHEDTEMTQHCLAL
jgi:hypothetical protein